MKRCPECRRDYYDDTLIYCLDDGNTLLEGPAHFESRAVVGTSNTNEEPATAILSESSVPLVGRPASEGLTQAQINTTNQTAILSKMDEATPKSRVDKRLIATPLLLMILALGGYFGYRYFRPNSRQIESIAVMPFVNESSNADIEYLSDGMTESLINSLSHIPNLKVMSRNSVFRYKGSDLDTQKVGAELKVQAVVTGSVKHLGDQLIIKISIDDTLDNHHIWGEQYSRRQLDVITVQSEIARDVSSKLKSKLSGEDERRVAKTYTANPEAYQLYLQGLYHWNKRTPDDLRKSIALFQQATEKDPSYAQAYAWLALAYSVVNANTRMTRQELAEIWLKERAAMQRAHFRIAPGSAPRSGR